ncbi:4-alpha-glucanotransferase [Promicromonospora sukumoe]|uniref:4-alpha-glucanotransferase n=1 Tax=Promicromonospora sukumoe TaxID=88382 RepID=A0A7W3PCG4_9MICO|nr:4-alpha-glucanotransferase [Promicromonospora sukumoe]MBA8806517.1 4-alpha-glucanotransferase [Promicromonospora sukumoe]
MTDEPKPGSTGDGSTVPPELAELATAHGVQCEYTDHDGRLQQVSPSTLVAVLEALGVQASTPGAVTASVERAKDDEWRAMLPSAVVTREGTEVQVAVHVADGADVTAWVELEQTETPAVPASATPWRVAAPGATTATGSFATVRGTRVQLRQADVVTEPRTVDSRKVGRATFTLPDTLPLGWHTLHAESAGQSARTTLVVTPARLELREEIARKQAWGFMVQLYSVRSRDSWGMGDLADLGDLAWQTAHNGGADFVAINPLHATEPVLPLTPSPYLPTSRRFMSPLYVRVEDIRETAYLSAADRSLVEWAAEPVRELSEDSGPIDRDAIWEAKKAALEVVWTAPRSAARQTAFDEFVLAQGRGLVDFATWCAIKEHLDGRDWPAELSDPGSSGVQTLRNALADRVQFYCWLQWVLDEQLRAAHRAGLDAGMRLGVFKDLAVGSNPEGADAWSDAAVLARGVSVGAPPDMYNQQGQNWGLPPWHPRALAKAGYAPYRDLLRSVLRHCGGVRIDHILGLFRLWWIPGGARASAGAYVTYDHEALIGILCLEAHRAGVAVVGEDLGTFEPWIREYLAERGVLGTSVLLFERDESGAPIEPEAYRSAALATVTTHDLPPTAGYLAGEHVDLRERLGLLTEDATVLRARARQERESLVEVLSRRGLTTFDPSERELVEGLHRYLKDTPAALVGVSLADAVGERRAQNQPGTDSEYPNWRVPLADSAGTVVLLEDLFSNARLRSLVTVMNEEPPA